MRRLVSLVAGLMVAANASAGWTPDAEACRAATLVDERIAACMRAITSGQLTNLELAVTHSNRGNAWRTKGNPERAIADYNEAIRLNPRNSVAYYNRAITWRDSAANDRAIADYNEAIRLNPRYANAYYNRGIAWRSKGDNDRAITDYSEAIRLDPLNANAYNNRGIAWRAKGNPERAIADYNEAIRLNPQSSIAYNNRGIAWSNKGDNARAIADYDEAIRFNAQNANAYLNRGRSRFYQGQFPAAENDFVEAHRLRLDAYAVIWLYLARARGGRHDVTELASDSRRFTGSAWPEPVIQLFLGQLNVGGLMSAATNPDSSSQAANECEARFFLAEWDLVRGDRKSAEQRFRGVQQACPKPNPEYFGAEAELKRLAPQNK